MSNPSKFNFDKANALILDADLLCMQVVVGMLAGFGFRNFRRCTGCKQAVDFLNMQVIDVVIMDPAGFGDEAYDLVKWIRESRTQINCDTTILLTTGYASVGTVSRMKSSGADFLICKPFSTSGLLDRLLWVANNDGMRGQFLAPQSVVSADGSGVDLW
jgi:DNA-binding response OmpR family regulator